jgi:hypothetical protein
MLPDLNLQSKFQGTSDHHVKIRVKIANSYIIFCLVGDEFWEKKSSCREEKFRKGELLKYSPRQKRKITCIGHRGICSRFVCLDCTVNICPPWREDIVTCIARQQTDKHLVICARNNRTNVYVTGCSAMTQINTRSQKYGDFSLRSVPRLYNPS